MPYYPISKIYTVKDVISSARELTRATSVDDLLNEQEKLIYKLSLSELYNFLVSAGRKDYQTSILSVMGQNIYDADIGGINTSLQYYADGRVEVIINTRLILDPGLETFLRYHNIIALAGKVQFIFKEYADYRQIISSEFKSNIYRNGAIWTLKDDNIHITYGPEVQIPSNNEEVCEVIFNRLPIIPDNTTEWNTQYVDLPDAYIPALFHRIASLMLYQKSGVLLEPSLRMLDIFYQTTLMGLRLEDEQTRSQVLEKLASKPKVQEK